MPHASATAIDRTGPKRFELFLIKPIDLDRYTDLGVRNAWMPMQSRTPWTSSGDWDRWTKPISQHEKMSLLRRRFVEGLPWEQTGIYELVLRNLEQRQRLVGSRSTPRYDGCSSTKDIADRYQRLDAIFERVKRDGRLQTAWELTPTPAAQRQAIWTQLDRDGRFLFGNVGCHRLAIAHALSLPYVPVALTIAHTQAVRDGHLSRWRNERSRMLKILNLRLPREAFSLPRNLVAELDARRGSCPNPGRSPNGEADG